VTASRSRLPLGWVTDLAVLEHLGSTVEDRGDHLVVRTPQNPDFHWGNCLFVSDPDAVDDAARWVREFERSVPGADWVAIGLAGMPTDESAWSRYGLDLGLDDVLATSTLPRQTTRPDGYEVRALAGEDWAQLVSRAVAENDRTAEHDPGQYERFTRARTQGQRDLAERGVATFVGAFFEERLVADLGIVDCSGTARYQNVGTAIEHRGRGIASHLLGVAATWASARGCTRWVIVTEATNPAGRVYRSAGFTLAEPSVQAYRAASR
jgi:GNAT superfamily N-acetyltransferase